MTQLEFDTMMNVIRQEQQENNEQLRAELTEIEGRRLEARKAYDEAHEFYKQVCNEVTQKQRELKLANAQFYERKKALIKAFPKAIGKRLQKNEGMNKHELFGIRASMIKQLKEKYAESHDIDAEGIDVHFNVEGDKVVFSAVLPTKVSTNGKED